MKTAHKTFSIYTEHYWDNEWKNIFEHYQQDLRHAYYIQAVLNSDEKKLLELGSGSFRDAAFLNKQNIDCYGVDYSTVAVQMANMFFEDDLINLGLETPTNIRKSFECHKMDQLEISERLLCIVNLKK